MRQLLWVGIGGFVGSIARYKLGGFVLHRSEAWNFPVSTFAVNLLGCLAIGILAALVEHHDLFSNTTRLFLFTGLLGGFTTFSAFSLDAVLLWEKNAFALLGLYVVASVVLSILGLFTGLWIVRSLT